MNSQGSRSKRLLSRLHLNLKKRNLWVMNISYFKSLKGFGISSLRVKFLRSVARQGRGILKF